MKDSKKTKLEKIYSDYAAEFKGRCIVPGSGNADAGMLLVGEAPGAEEIKRGLPFVGRAGEILSGILKKLDISRDEIYITNAIKYGLRIKDPKTGRESNRPAKKAEMKSSRPFLMEEIECVDPRIIVTLGGVSLKTILDAYDISVTKHSGKEIDYNGRVIYPLLHPAALIYDRSLSDVFDENLTGLRETIGRKYKQI